ncbi:TolB family protein [Bowmanella dokdonensis]|nr:hypothetical protein [Bowmanella dokdonensis]
MSSSHDSPGWSPDSQWLAYRKLNKDAKGDTWLVRLADGQHRQVTNNPKHEDSKVQWSPDGRSLLYDSRRNKEFNIYRFDLQTDQEHKLTDLPSSDIGPIWSSDGALISFLSTRGPHGRTQLYLMKEDGSDQHSITDGVNQVDDPVWLDENSMLMVSWRGNRFSNLYLVDLKTRTWRPLAPVDGYQSQPLPEPVLLPGTDRGGNHQESANVWK